MNGEKSEKGQGLRWLRAILSWVSRPISWLYHTLMDWRVWKDWPWWVKVIAVIWMLLPFPHLYEILKIWLPWIHTLLDEIGIRLPELSQPELSQPELSQPAPSLPAPSQEEQNQSLFDQVRTSMLVIAAWYGVFFLIWRTVLADRQTRSTEMQTHSVEMQTQINRENHYTDLFTKAVEQLGATRPDGLPAIEIRIGAIFALERLAKDSERDYGPIIETLAAYIREHCRNPKLFDDEGLSGDALKQARQKWVDSLRKNPPANRSDVAAVLTVLSRREQNRHWTSTSENETQPDFTGANFQGATLWNKSEGLAREGTNLRLVYLDGADLREANLSGADLREANLSGAELMGVDLSGADLREAILSDAILIRANLSGAELMGVDLSDVVLALVNLSGAKLMEADLSGANLRDLSDADLWGAKLSDAKLDDADLSGADFEGTLLIGTQLKDSRGLTDDMIKKAFGDGDTSLPDGLTRPAHWESREKAIEQWRAFRKKR